MAKNDTKKQEKTEPAKKIEHTYYFLGGLPRSGSTLLCNILAQNPNIQTGPASGVMDVMFLIRNNWDNLIEFKANPNETGKLRVMRGVLDSYYSNVDKPVIIDKSRGWIAFLEMAEEVLGHKAKVIVPVRDVRDILASFEKLWRRNSSTKQTQQEKDNFWKYQSVEGRAEIWLQNNQPVGLAYNRIKDAITRGFSDRMLFVDFDKLTKEPEEQLKRIYKFLGEEYFQHDFDNVKQIFWENDEVYGFKDLHNIRSKVEPIKPQWPTVLGPFAEKQGKLNFWDKLI